MVRGKIRSHGPPILAVSSYPDVSEFLSPFSTFPPIPPFHIKAMDVTQLYAIVAGGLFALLTVLNFCFRLWKITQKCSAVVLRYIVYPLFLRRHRLMGPWSRSGFLLRFAYIAANIFCSGFRIVSVPEASNRTGTLSLINMLPLFLGPHLSFLAVMMGLSLHNFQAVHGSSAFVSVLLSAAHTGLGLSGSGAYSFHEPSHLYGLIVRIPRANDINRLTPT